MQANTLKGKSKGKVAKKRYSDAIKGRSKRAGADAHHFGKPAPDGHDMPDTGQSYPSRTFPTPAPSPRLGD